jgi:DNA-binding CsgD family transcriptional regulator
MGIGGNQPSDDEATGSQREPDLILSPREKALLRRLAQGKSDKLIAKQMGGTKLQIAAQRQRLIDKLGIRSPTQLAAAAERLARITRRAKPPYVTASPPHHRYGASSATASRHHHDARQATGRPQARR